MGTPLIQVKPQITSIPKIQGRVGTPQVHAQSSFVTNQKLTPQPFTGSSSGNTGILAQRGPVTQTFGQPSQYDIFSHGKSPAHEIAVPEGTMLRTPPGTWKVLSTFNQANPRGFIGDKQGQGWGNNVRLQNTQTGDVVGYNHMRNVAVQPGQVLPGGFAVGPSGMSGNATGPHVAFTYADARGRVGDFNQSPYAQYTFSGVPPVNSQPGMTTQEGIGLASTPPDGQKSLMQFFQPDIVQPIQAPDLQGPIVQNTLPQPENYSQAPGRYSQIPGSKPMGQGGGTNGYIVNGANSDQRSTSLFGPRIMYYSGTS